MSFFNKIYFIKFVVILFVLFISNSISKSQSTNSDDIVNINRIYYSLKNSGEEFLREGNFQNAIRFFRQALILSGEIDHCDEEVNCYMKLGLLHWNIGQLTESLKYYKRAFSIAEKFSLFTKQRECQSYIRIFELYNEGKNHRSSGKYQESIKSFQEAIQFAKRTGSREHEVKCLRQLSATYWDLNDLQKFLSLNEEALEIAQELNNKKEEARCLNNIGISYDKKNYYSKALNYYHKALEITQQLDNKEIEESILLNNIGIIYMSIGDYNNALFYLKKSLSIDRQIGKRTFISKDLNNIGLTYRNRGLYSKNEQDFHEALNYYFDCLRLTKKTEDKKTEIQVLSNIGTVYIDLKNYDKAIKFFQLSFVKSEAIRDLEATGMILNNLGIVHFYLKNYDRAIAYFNRALEVGLDLQAGQILWEAYFWLGQCYEVYNQFSKAIDCYKMSISVIEYIRGQIFLDTYKAGFVKDKLRIYENLIGLLFRLYAGNKSGKFVEEIFRMVERAKAQAFLENLRESRIDIKERLNPEFSYREKKISSEISSIVVKLSQTDLSEEKREDLILKLKQKEDEYVEFISKIRAEIPEVAKLVSPEPCHLKDLVGQLLDNKTALIEYFLGERRSLMFLVTKDRVNLYSLPSKESIERSLRAYLKILSQPPSGKFEGFLASKRIYKEFLSQALKSVPDSIENLVIIPDGILYYFPFETLIITSQDQDKQDKFLIEEYKVASAPSSSSLLFLLKKKLKKNTSKGFLAFANPFYDIKSSSGNNGHRLYTEVLKELYSNQGSDLTSLPFSQEEVEEISKYFPKNKRNIYLKKEAREDIVKDISLENYNIIHFACHGIIDEEYPYRSALVLALDEDMNEDGFLQVREIYNLRMNADLIVLSACQTGRGKLEKWEGVMGLPRIFFYAGAGSVVSTLWKVSDKSTARFMWSFYRYLSQGKTKAHAIQLAKLEMIRSKYSHPFYWGAFLLHGDYSSRLDFD